MKVSAVMEKIELNADETEAAAKKSEDGSKSNMTFLVPIDSLYCQALRQTKPRWLRKRVLRTTPFLRSIRPPTVLHCTECSTMSSILQCHQFYFQSCSFRFCSFRFCS